MKRFLKIYLCVIAFLCCVCTSKAQDASTAPIFTADSLVSGNTKDILTKFFQLAFNNLTGNNKEFNFTSNPFAIMLKSNPKLNVDHYYSKFNALRKLNFSFGIRLDTSFKFNGFSSGAKYSIIDQRDYTTSRLFAVGLRINGMADERKALNDTLRKFAIEKFKIDSNRQERADFLKNVSRFFNEEVPFDQLDTAFRSTVIRLIQEKNLIRIQSLLAENPSSSLKTNDLQVFEALKDSIKNCALWTIGIADTTYRDQFFFQNIVINSEFSKGIFKPQPGANNVELNIKAAANFSNDDLQAGRNLKRAIFSFEPGINWVIRDKNADRSFFELKLSGSYYHNFTRLYEGEERDNITMNGTARIRILEDIWVPLEIRYDPTNGNVFGFLNVKANFTGMGKMLKKAVQ